MFLKKNDTARKVHLVKLLLVALIITPIQFVFSHGTVTSPASRVWNCFLEDPENPDSPACRDAVLNYGTQAFYDWNEVARMDANGMHRQLIADGTLASAGRPEKYGGLDQVRNDWVATPVKPGPLTMTWSITAPHETLYYEVYITKADWTPDQPLTWDSLELLVRTGSRPSAESDDIDIVLPQRTGKHVLYSVWQRSLSAEAFYSTSDIDFGTEPILNRPPVANFESERDSCNNNSFNFNAEQSNDPDGDTLVYNWNFGDGTTAQGINVSHNFNNNTTNTITLTVNDGNTAVKNTKTIQVTPCDPNTIDALSIEADILSGNAPLVISFKNNTTIFQENNTTITYNWNFGDGTSSTEANPTKTYTSPGLYTATLTATGPVNSRITKTTIIVRNQLAIDIGLTLEYRNTCTNATNNTSTTCDNTINNVIAPNLIINNNSNEGVNYENLSIRYWFTSADNKDFNFICDWAQFGTEFVNGNYSTAQGFDYLELTFDAQAGNLAKNSNSGQINTRFNKTNWTNFDQADDYSFDLTKSEYAEHDRVTLYKNGTLVYGIEPSLLSLNNDTAPPHHHHPKENKNTFSIYPNPARDIMYIEDAHNLEGKTITIYNLTGKVVTSKSLSDHHHKSKTDFNTSTLQAGLYMIEIKDKTGIKTSKKLIIN